MPDIASEIRLEMAKQKKFISPALQQKSDF